MGKIIEGFWDCKHCNTVGIRGGIRECPNCSKARDENTTFYLNKKKISYVSKEKAASINRNPDWICKYCNGLNSDNNKTCVSCAAPRTDKNLNYFQNRSKKIKEKNEELLENTQFEEEKDVSYDSLYDLSNDDNSNNMSHNYPEKNTYFLKNILFSTFSKIFLILFSLIGIGGLIYLLIPKPQEITIEEMSWAYSIDIDRYQTVEESGESLPSGARLLYSKEEFSHYEQVLDHYETVSVEVPKEVCVGTEEIVVGYEDLGNGYFEEITEERNIYETYYVTETYDEPVYRDEPVYITIYYYEIDKWVYERSVKTSGYDKNPYWGNVTLASDEKIASEIENYYIGGLNQKGKEIKVSLSFEDWNSLEIGQTVKLKVFLGYGEIVE